MKTVDEMMEDIRARVKKSLATRPHALYQFTALGHTVLRRGEVVARAKSHTFARRITAALNRYLPGPKGY